MRILTIEGSGLSIGLLNVIINKPYNSENFLRKKQIKLQEPASIQCESSITMTTGCCLSTHSNNAVNKSLNLSKRAIYRYQIKKSN